MQFPKANRDLLIFAPSIILNPRFPVFAALSEPARSIKESFPILISDFIPESLSLYSTIICRTAWDLDEVSFAPVASYVLLRFPYIRSSNISSGVWTSISLKPATQTPLIGSSLRSRKSLETIIKSLMFSL